MGELVKKTVVMNEADWRELAGKAVTLAVVALHDEYDSAGALASRIVRAAELLRAAKALGGHANMRELTGDVDTAVVEVWDLSDEMEGEDDEPIWPELSAKLREIAGADPKLLPVVDQIDRLHKLAVERGMPVITRAQFEREMEQAQ